MKRIHLWLVLLVVPLLVATQAEAQGLPTGTLAGRVTETQGTTLPGVTVTAKSPALQGVRVAVTNNNGDFIIPNLPPGQYVVSFVISGFQNVTRDIKVSSGQQVPMNVQLSIAAVSAEAVVVAQSETVSQTSAASSTLSTELTTKLPVTRTILSSVVLSPGVNQNGPGGNVTVSGGQSFDNVFTVNGVNIQDNIRGTPTNQLVIEDAIQETTTMTSGVSAEYGRFTGGVINAVTKQGGNLFSGSIRASLANDNWQSQTPIDVQHTDKVVPTYEATLGGPVLKDRVWFFGAGRYNKNEFSGVTTPVNPGDPTITFPRADKDTRYEGKLTLTPFTNQTLTGSYTKGNVESSNYVYPFPVLDLNVSYPRSTPTDLLSINYNGVLSSNFFAEAQYSKKTFDFKDSGSRVNELIGGTALLVLDQGLGQMWSPIFCAVCPGATEKRDNDDFLVKGTYFLSTKGVGSHSIVFGYDRFAAQHLSNNWQSGSSWVLLPTSVKSVGGNLYPVIDDSSYFEYFPIPKLAQPSELKTQSVFVNDTWKLNNNFSFNLGVRYDKNDATDMGGAKTANDHAFSPRLAANYDVSGKGTMRLTASYATYVGQLQEGIAGSGATSAGSPASYYYFWTGAPINADSNGPLLTTDQVLRQMFGTLGVTGLNQFPNVAPDIVTLPGVNLQVANGGLSSPKTHEFVLGVGGTIGQNVTFRVDGVRREYRDFYATQRDLTTGKVTDSLGNVYDLGFLVNSNLPRREYTGLHTSMAFRKGPLNLAANWSWSHMIGNFVGETKGSGPVTAGGLQNYPEYFDPKWSVPVGDLSQDQRHRVRLLATYDLSAGPVRITPGLVQAFDTGTPYGAVGNIPTQPYVTNPGYESPPPTVPYYFTSRDAFRTDDIWRTDLSLNLAANVGPVEIFVLPQILNVFNNDAVITPNTAVFVGTGTTANSRGLVRFDPFTSAAIECPQADTAAQCAALGANWKKGATFGAPTTGGQTGSFQLPRTWSVSMGVRF